MSISAYRYAGTAKDVAPLGRVDEPPAGASPGLEGRSRDAASATLQEDWVGEVRRAVRARLDIAPRPVPAQRLAFGAGRLGWLTEDELVVLDEESFDEVARLAVKGGRRLVALADGALLAFGATGALRLNRREDRPVQLPRPSLFAQSQIHPDRVDPRLFWVLHGFGNTLYRYRAEVEQELSNLLPINGKLTLEGFDSGAFGSLRDGSFLYTSRDGFVRMHPTGKRNTLAGDSAGVWRILAAHRIDSAWVIRDDGRAMLCRLGAKLVPVRTVELDAVPFAAAADNGVLGVVVAGAAEDASRTWEVVVLGSDGKPWLRRSIEMQGLRTAGVSSTRDWVERLTRNRTVAVSASPPLVAVGGSDAIAVWHAKSGVERLMLAE